MNISSIGMGMKTEFLMSETITCPTCGGAAHIGRMESTDATFKLTAVTDEQKSKKIGQLKKRSRDALINLRRPKRASRCWSNSYQISLPLKGRISECYVAPKEYIRFSLLTVL